jgi:hypothetical protein
MDLIGTSIVIPAQPSNTFLITPACCPYCSCQNQYFYKLKSASAYYLLLIYIAAMCKPVLPVVKDVLAHAFWQESHTATVHQKSGEDHVHQEVKDMEGNHTDDSGVPAKFTEPVSVHLLMQYCCNFFYSFAVTDNRLQRVCSFTAPILNVIIPPPKS